MDDDTRTIGRRLREVRHWRGLSLTVTAELAGLSAPFLSRVERGERAVQRRSTLEALARALRVAPSELTGQPFRMTDPRTAEAHAAVAALEVALAEPALGDTDLGPPRREWPELATELRRLNNELRPAADYTEQARVLPGMLTNLHAIAGRAPERQVLVGLMDCYHAAEELTKTLGVPGLPQLAAVHAQTVAEQLDTPAWLGLAAWVRTMAIGTSSRDRMLSLSRHTAEELQPTVGSDPDTAQMYGAAHLNAALACAALNRPVDAADHLAEADEVTRAIPAEAAWFGHVFFGPANIGIWRVSLAVEQGEPGKAAELARTVDVDALPSAARRAMFHGDLGRGLAVDKRTRTRAAAELHRAEDIAPTLVRSNVFVREAVSELLRRVRRDDTIGRALRGMAYRMGIAG